jgi:hypothetical protein
MTEVEIDVPAEKYCTACGADEQSDPEMTGGFLPFIILLVPTSHAASEVALGHIPSPFACRWLCAGCLASVLKEAGVGWAGQVAELAIAQKGRQEHGQAPE